MIKTLYKKLMGVDSCKRIGKHWQDIGFQHTDPGTDIRGAGMLGVVHMLFFIGKFPATAKEILKYSHHQKYEFPMAVTMFEFTTRILDLMRRGHLYAWCNQSGDVWLPVC